MSVVVGLLAPGGLNVQEPQRRQETLWNIWDGSGEVSKPFLARDRNGESDSFPWTDDWMGKQMSTNERYLVMDESVEKKLMGGFI